jgi:hypothetical protein
MSTANRFAPGAIDGPHRAVPRRNIRRWAIAALALLTCATVVLVLCGGLS